MSGATVFRRKGPAWRFEWEHSAGMFIHRTKAGTVYGVCGISEAKPLWIGRLVEKAFFPCEINAERIQFDGAGEYWFQ